MDNACLIGSLSYYCISAFHYLIVCFIACLFDSDTSVSIPTKYPLGLFWCQNYQGNGFWTDLSKKKLQYGCQLSQLVDWDLYSIDKLIRTLQWNQRLDRCFFNWIVSQVILVRFTLPELHLYKWCLIITKKILTSTSSFDIPFPWSVMSGLGRIPATKLPLKNVAFLVTSRHRVISFSDGIAAMAGFPQRCEMPIRLPHVLRVSSRSTATLEMNSHLEDHPCWYVVKNHG